MLVNAVERYKQVRATTSTQGDLLLALYDGLFRFLKGARVCIGRKELARAREFLSKCYAIVSELHVALDHNVSPDLCAQLAGVYSFSLDRIQAASRNGDTAAIDEVMKVLTPLREAWKLAVPKAAVELKSNRKRA